MDIVSCTTAITACEKGLEWQLAIDLLCSMAPSSVEVNDRGDDNSVYKLPPLPAPPPPAITMESLAALFDEKLRPVTSRLDHLQSAVEVRLQKLEERINLSEGRIAELED